MRDDKDMPSKDGRRDPDPPIRGGLSRLRFGAVFVQAVGMGGGGWGEVSQCFRILHPRGGKIAE